MVAGSVVCSFGIFYFFVSNYNTYKKLVAVTPPETPVPEESGWGNPA